MALDGGEETDGGGEEKQKIGEGRDRGRRVGMQQAPEREGGSVEGQRRTTQLKHKSWKALVIMMTTGIKMNDDEQVDAKGGVRRAEALPLVMTLVKSVADDGGGGGCDGCGGGGGDCGPFV